PLLALALALVLASMRPAAAMPAPPDLCPPDPDLIAAPMQLEPFAHAVHAGGPVDVLALGSASTAGGAASYPRVMMEALQAALPSADLRLTVHAARGLSAGDMVDQMPETLAQHRYALVLWQTGTVDAVQGLRPDELAQSLEQGAALVAAAGASLVLIDFQYSRFLSANVDLAPYEQALERTASLTGAALFHRYALMRSWADAGGLDIEMALPAKRPETSRLLHACLGHALARFILSGIGTAPPTH
ncbi:MAG: hypothetical protein WBQ75_22400, partial [Acetobacteraceae bacterium]